MNVRRDHGIEELASGLAVVHQLLRTDVSCCFGEVVILLLINEVLLQTEEQVRDIPHSMPIQFYSTVFFHGLLL